MAAAQQQIKLCHWKPCCKLETQRAGGDGAANDFAAGNEDDEQEEEEPQETVEIKGNEDCEILVTGRAKMTVKQDDGSYDGGVVGTLTLRKAKESSQCWVQVNGQTVRPGAVCVQAVARIARAAWQPAATTCLFVPATVSDTYNEMNRAASQAAGLRFCLCG